ncbi:MAG: hypothetical protein B6I25_06515 [Planctomycetales bacterium 4572_13]|nr:MAG: hypothetical protein B6I25_06515 [Planctomycetales bacterium 4572_13]
MVSLGVTKLREDISDIVNRVRYTGERITIEKQGKAACVIVSLDDLKLLEAIEDAIDIEAAEESIKRNDFVDWDIAKKKLGL